MGDEPRNAWQCPSCGRQRPRGVEVCRCGSERRRLEALGYTFNRPPQPTPAAATRRAHVPTHGPAAALIGYRLDTDLGRAWRVVLKSLFAIAVVLVGAATATLIYTEPLPRRGNVRILSTLDRFTQNAGPDAGNTIPSFLASAGRTGALAVAGDADDPVRSLEDTDLRLGFCSQNVAKHVRHEYPGYYESWPDEKLVKTVIAKHPEYADRLCTLPFRLEATPDEIVKYELTPRTLASHAGLWLITLLVAGAFAVVCLNIYYRGIIGRLASQG
jgi:hypothetical protein